MVDWDQVERLRGKGWDWSRIAADERVEFAAESSGGDAGRQLRTLYYQRRSKAQRKGSSGKLVKGEGGEEGPDSGRPPRLLRIAWAGVPLFAIWTLLAFVFPSPVGVFVPYFYLLAALVIFAFVLIFSIFRSSITWDATLRTPVVLGVVVGLVAAGTVTLAATFAGCPTLTGTAAASPLNGWVRYANPSWEDNGAPVFFFYGSIACPYCSASSWAMYDTFKQFGTFSSYTLTHSNPADQPANIPEVDLSSATLVSQYVALAIYEGTDDNHLTTPALPTCQLHSYVTTYDPTGTIPFVVIGGTYVHAGASLVDPSNLINQSTGQPYSPQEVKAQVDAQNGPAWNAVAAASYTMQAILVKLNGGQGPSGVISNSLVQAQLNQLK